MSPPIEPHRRAHGAEFTGLVEELRSEPGQHGGRCVLLDRGRGLRYELLLVPAAYGVACDAHAKAQIVTLSGAFVRYRRSRP